MCFPGGASGRVRLPMQETQETGFGPWVGKIPWSRKWQPTPVFLPEKFHGQEEPGGLYSPWGRSESDTTERLITHSPLKYKLAYSKGKQPQMEKK